MSKRQLLAFLVLLTFEAFGGSFGTRTGFLVVRTSAQSISGPVLVKDTFSGTDGAPLTSHPPDVNVPGHPWTVSGPMTVLRGQQLMPWAYDPSSFLSTAMIDTGSADGTVAADWTPTPASATTSGFPLGALVIRGVDASNYLGIGYGIWGGNALVIARFVGGNWTLVASADPGPLAGRTHHLEVKLAGSSIEVWSDGARLITATETTFQTATKHGFRWWTPYDWTSTFDNFTVQSPPPPPPPSTRVVVTPGTGVLTSGNSRTLTATAYSPTNVVVPNVAFTWTTSNATVASVVASGAATATATAASAGTATITATAPGGIAGTSAVTSVLASTLVYDTFTGPDATNVQGRLPEWTTTGTGWQLWGTPGADLLGNRLRTTGTGPTFEEAVVDSGAADATVAVDWMVPPAGVDAFAGVVLRATDANNFLLVCYYAGQIAAYRYQGAAFTALGASTPVTVAPGSVHRLAATATGPTLTVVWDGATIQTRTSTFQQTATRHGVSWAPWDDALTTYDNFAVQGPLPVVTRIVVTPDSRALLLGTSQTLTAVAYAANNVVMPNVAFTWTTSNAAVASVVASGGATASATATWTGSATITATAPNGIAGTAAVTSVPAGTLLYDTFTGPDGSTLPSHVPDLDASGGLWSVRGPMAELNQGQLTPWAYDPSSFLSTAMIDTGTADGTVAVDWTPAPPAPRSPGIQSARWSSAAWMRTITSGLATASGAATRWCSPGSSTATGRCSRRPIRGRWPARHTTSS